MTGLPAFSRWCWSTKISHSLQRKIQMENGNARQCFVMLQACSEKRGAMKNLFIDIFSIDDQLRQKAAHSMERTYKAATELSVRYTCRRKHPLLFSHALWSRPENFQTNFATTICSWPIAFSETHLTAKKSTKCHFSLQKKTEMPSGILIIKPFSTVLLMITLFKANEAPMNHESRNRYFTSM